VLNDILDTDSAEAGENLSRDELVDLHVLDALADRLRSESRRQQSSITAIGPVPLDRHHVVDAPLLVEVTPGDVEYEREQACFAGTERYSHLRRRKLAERVSRLLSLIER